jgi:phosphohistidine phosphatase
VLDKELLQLVPEVAIDEGTFKYVLLRITDTSSNATALIVRGDARAPYHNDILQRAKREVGAVWPGVAVEPVGGGRMEHIMSEHVQRVSVYGYSAAYGQAPHEVTAALVRKWLPWHEVLVSYDGY